jgi:type II secretory ATPase GspE/PulE/Tfp pilus assembly ATPase PilB-like protein
VRLTPTDDGTRRATLRFHVEVNALKNLPNAMLDRGVATGGAEPEQTAFALIDQCLAAAVQLGASDVHVEPQGDKLVLRLRVDGQLKIWKELPIEVHAQVMGRLKVMARLDISEKRRPQDGRFTQTSPAGVRDYRIATAPMLEGEKAVIRVLHHDLSKLNIKTVGYSEHNLKVYQEQLSKPHGLLLHCGPTGSGKTTALYAAINHLSKVSRNVQTIEDPVEGRLPGVNQAQVNSEIGVTFASFLRSYLRQDCDVILVGEIRDPETAQLAVQASMTGHLVLGTLHTNTAAGAIGRLCDMGVPPFFIAGALIGAVSQRLVRKLCKHCRQPIEVPPEIQRQCGLGPTHQLFQAVGCPQCNKLGYRGRVGIQEIFAVTGQIREAIAARTTEADLQTLNARNGMRNMFLDGVAKAVMGVTTLEEVYRNVVVDA